MCILATNILLRNASMSYKPNDIFLLTRTKFRHLDFFVTKLLIHTSRKEIILTKTTLWLMQFSQSAKILLLVLGLQNTRISSSQYSSRSALTVTILYSDTSSSRKRRKRVKRLLQVLGSQFTHIHSFILGAVHK